MRSSLAERLWNRRSPGVMLAVAACLAGATVAACAGSAKSEGTTTGSTTTTTSGGGTTGTASSTGRAAPIIYRPAGLSMANKVPLVIAMHGAGGGPQNMEGLSHFERLADANGFVVVYPDSSSTTAPWKPQSDFDYVSSLIQQVVASQNIDRSRIYVTGFSAGGYEAFNLGCNLSSQIAAIAVVSDGMATHLYNSCPITRPVSMLLMVGSQDVYYNGNPPKLASAAQVAAKWRSLNSCPATATPAAQQQVSTVLQQTWGPCVDGSSVALYVVQGAGHVWPPYGPGAPSDYSASSAIWSFFSQHRLSPSTLGGGRLVLLRASKSGRNRWVTAAFALDEPVSLSVALGRPARPVARRTVLLSAGTRQVVRVTVPSSTKAGRFLIVFSLRDAFGRTLTVERRVTLPAPYVPPKKKHAAKK